MTVVAIIAEYNPFHSGHKYQIDKIREQLGEDTAIVAIMSGNFTQRGEVAFAPKNVRAQCAISGGANLVLELPFPFSASSAEIFANASVKIADSLGIVDYISFGSESGNITELSDAAAICLSDEYKEAFKKLGETKGLGYPERCELAFRSLANTSELTFSPNNILAIEYIKALISQKSLIKPHTVKRMGASYTSEKIEPSVHQSAMAIRRGIMKADYDYFEHLPEECRSVIRNSYESGDLPCDGERISSAIISKLRLNPSLDLCNYHDANDGLYNRLKSASFEANDISSLLELSETKNYTKARIRRAMWSIFFGVTSSDVKKLPAYTQILAMDKTGMLLLKNARKCDEFRILTKPSDFNDFTDLQKRQKQFSDNADSVFELTKPQPKSGRSALKFTPYIKK